MAKKVGTPKGTRDFSPTEMAKRNYIFDTIREIYHIYGYSEIYTPAMENLSTLMGKYGDEGDKLLFKIINSGDFLSKVDGNEMLNTSSNQLLTKISEKGLRYDLTVPFARYVVNHQSEITFPFKRFQIQPVWRADRPQKGRYREFYQCDADIVGSNSLINEAELLRIIDRVFKKLKLNITIKLNNRKLLSAISKYINHPELLTDITVAIDKLDKIGWENVSAELSNKGLSTEELSKLEPILYLSGNNVEKLDSLKSIFKGNELAETGVAELAELFALCRKYHITCNIELDLSLARGLNYYTGTIIEVKSDDMQIGSICGGGRYDNLTAIFGMDNVSGVGVSFGADRIYDVLEHIDGFPKKTSVGTEVLFVNFGEQEQNYAIPLLESLRNDGIRAEIFPDSAKMKKQMSWANNNNVPIVAIIGEDEISQNSIIIKNMHSGEQIQTNNADLVSTIKNMLNA
ncbi:MAG: histidine--tRNA ligase [Bacteroidales bacterium]